MSNIKTTIQEAKAEVQSGHVFKQLRSDEGYLVRVQTTQRRLSNRIQLRVHVWDANGELLRADAVQKLTA